MESPLLPHMSSGPDMWAVFKPATGSTNNWPYRGGLVYNRTDYESEKLNCASQLILHGQ